MNLNKEDMNGIKIDFDILKRNKLTVIEYVMLWWVYHKKAKLFEETLDDFGLHLVKADVLEQLESKAYIKISTFTKGEFNTPRLELRNDIRTLFEGDKDTFATWLGTFPIKTPSRRYLSPVDPDTIMGKKLRKKWDKLFKNNAGGALKALAVLKAEMEWRRKHSTMEYMHNAETWLNQGDFEKYEYLLTDKSTQQAKIREDFE